MEMFREMAKLQEESEQGHWWVRSAIFDGLNIQNCFVCTPLYKHGAEDTKTEAQLCVYATKDAVAIAWED
jgi:hypothetical protein